jgi:alkanesulfonate monooxygenase SsuD/methylene tetrahydromethanopterin reductase-like flavin-dependent oxidoreductase (luciferase family)
VIDALDLGVELPAVPAGRPQEAEGVLPALRACADIAEAAGAGAVWLDAGSPGDDGADPCVLAGALGAVTSAVVVGVVDRLDGRVPAVLARDVTAVHLVSGGGGALLLCLPGFRARPGTDPIGRLLEAAGICRAVLAGDLPVVDGTHFSVGGSIDRPPPPPGRRPALVVDVGGDLGRSSAGKLSELGSLADALAVGGGPDEVAVLADALGPPPRPPLVWRGTLPSDGGELAGRLRHAGADGLLVRPAGRPAVEEWASAVAEALSPAAVGAAR